MILRFLRAALSASGDKEDGDRLLKTTPVNAGQAENPVHGF